MLAAFVHGSVGLEVSLNVPFVLLEHEVGLLLRSVGRQDTVEVTSDSVLVLMEAIKVNFPNGVDVVGHQLPQHTPSTVVISIIRGTLTCIDELLFAHG